MPVLNHASRLYLGAVRLDAAHADAHRVFPMPPPYLDGPMGQVSTPDTPADTIMSDLRIRSKVRVVGAFPTSPALVAMQRSTAAANITMDWGLNVDRFRWRLANDVGNGLQMSPAVTVSGELPVDRDVWVGARMERAGVANVHFAGERSSDGITWTDNGVVNDYTTRTAIFDTTQPIIVAPTGIAGFARFPGRIYWSELAAIHRAQLVFPGVIGNYLETPHQPAFAITGPFELVFRMSLDWQTAVDQYTFAARFATTGTGGRSWQFWLDPQYPGRPRMSLSVDGSASATTATATSAVPFTNGQMGWLKVTVDPNITNGVTKMFSAPDAGLLNEPTTWTTVGGDRPTAVGPLYAGTAPLQIGRQAVSDNGPLRGRISRMIMRNGIGGPVVFDMREHDAGKIGAGSTFTAFSGHVMTVRQTTGQRIVVPQPDAVVWRFDASEWPPAALTLTDPRGRAWTATVSPDHPASEPDAA